MAQRAGVSTALVSYVLNDGPRPVSQAARARVLAAIDELGYHRDGVARMLALGRSSTLGLVVPDIVMPYFGRLSQAISSLAFEQGLELLVATTDWDLAKEQANLRALVERRVEGIIVVSVDRHQDFGPYTAMGAPIVVVDRPEFAVRGSALVTEHLIGHGHERVAMLGGPTGIASTRRRREGWRDVLVTNGLHAGDDYVCAAALTESGGYHAVDQVLAMKPTPTAALVSHDVQAAGAVRRLYELGVTVPTDFAFAVANATDLAQFTVPSLTSLVAPTDEIARAAIGALGQAGDDLVQTINLANYTLAKRESCGCTAPRTGDLE